MSGPEFTLFGKKPMGYIVNMNSGNLEGTWQVWIEIYSYLVIIRRRKAAKCKKRENTYFIFLIILRMKTPRLRNKSNGSALGMQIRIRIQEGKNDPPKNIKREEILIFEV